MSMGDDTLHPDTMRDLMNETELKTLRGEIERIHALLDETGLARHDQSASERLDGYLTLFDAKEVLPNVKMKLEEIARVLDKVYAKATLGEIAEDPVVHEAFQRLVRLGLWVSPIEVVEAYRAAIEAVLKRAFK